MTSAPGTRAAITPPCCHDEHLQVAPVGAPVVALVGSPNVGKSTLFNALTGARRAVGNWPGTTVEIGRGSWTGTTTYDLLDLPGAYSLDPASPDEALTRQLLVEVPALERPELVVVIADAAHLARSLYLLAQLREHPYRLVVAVTMGDVARRRGLTIDPSVLSTALGVPVVTVDPRHRDGLAELAAAVDQALSAPPVAPRSTPLTEAPDGADPSELEFAVADDRFGWVEQAVAGASTRSATRAVNWTERVDRVALSRLWGPLVFLAVMWLVFQITTAVAAPLQDGLDALVAGPLSNGASALLRAAGLDGPIVGGLLIDGLLAGVGMLLTFVPLMALMFVLLALLEDSGYLARAAVVTDRMMRWIGLPGRAFLPLIVGFGCNVPAVSATRVLATRRQRVLTALLVPFTSCSARLTVFVMLASVFFPGHAGTVVFIMYLVSVLLIVGTGLLLRATLWRAMGQEPLIIDLPAYQRPTVRVVGMSTWVRLKGFLKTATGIIVATVAVVWVLQATPVTGSAGFAQATIED